MNLFKCCLLILFYYLIICAGFRSPSRAGRKPFAAVIISRVSFINVITFKFSIIQIFLTIIELLSKVCFSFCGTNSFFLCLGQQSFKNINFNYQSNNFSMRYDLLIKNRLLILFCYVTCVRRKYIKLWGRSLRVFGIIFQL